MPSRTDYARVRRNQTFRGKGSHVANKLPPWSLRKLFSPVPARNPTSGAPYLMNGSVASLAGNGPQDSLEDLERFTFERSSDEQELHEIDPALSPLIIRDERLRLA
jgi:hypothetical protein